MVFLSNLGRTVRRLSAPALAAAGRGRARILVAEVDAALVEVVGRHLHGDFVAGQDADAVFLHAPRGVGDHHVPVVELYAAARIGQHLVDDAFEFQHLFLGHALSSPGHPMRSCEGSLSAAAAQRAGRDQKASSTGFAGRIWARRTAAASENWAAGRVSPPRRSRDRDPCPAHPGFLGATRRGILEPTLQITAAQSGEAMQGTIGRIVLGFIAAAISVVVVHEGIIYLLNAGGYIPTHGWSMTPAIPPWGVPRLVNNIFWGGLWGALFGLIYAWIPGGMAWLKGLIFGLLIVVVSNWILLPLIKGQVFGQGNQVLFGGWNPTRMWIVAVIVGGFGLGLGIIYGLIGPRGRTT